MPCLLLTGVNNNGKTIIFGMALLESETTENFIWALTKLDEIQFSLLKKPRNPNN